MSHKSVSSTAVSTIGIDLGKNSFHLVGLDQRASWGCELLRRKKQLRRCAQSVCGSGDEPRRGAVRYI